MNRDDRRVVRKAARMLRQYAKALFEGEVERGDTNQNKGKVLDAGARADIREHCSVASKLMAMARRRSA